MAKVSDSVGCGCTVRPMSSASHPISMASAASAMRSPALGPTIAQPMRRPVSSSHSVLVSALVAAQRQRAAARRPRKHRLAVADPFRLGFRLGDADPGDLGVGVGDRGDDLGVERRFLPARRFRRDLALVRGFVGEHRRTDDVADGEDVGDVGAHLLVDGDKAARVDCDARVVGADQRRRSACGQPTPASRQKFRRPSRPRPRRKHAARRQAPRPWSPWS